MINNFARRCAPIARNVRAFSQDLEAERSRWKKVSFGKFRGLQNDLLARKNINRADGEQREGEGEGEGESRAFLLRASGVERDGEAAGQSRA